MVVEKARLYAFTIWNKKFFTKQKTFVVKEEKFFTKEWTFIIKEKKFFTKEWTFIIKEEKFFTKEWTSVIKEEKFFTKEKLCQDDLEIGGSFWGASWRNHFINNLRQKLSTILRRYHRIILRESPAKIKKRVWEIGKHLHFEKNFANFCSFFWLCKILFYININLNVLIFNNLQSKLHKTCRKTFVIRRISNFFKFKKLHYPDFKTLTKSLFQFFS